MTVPAAIERTPRALLFSPGDDERKLGKALAGDAACVIADLEDAVEESAKDRARDTVARTLATRPDEGGPACAVRVNALDTPQAGADLEMVIAAHADLVVVPKAEPESLAELAARNLGLPPILAIVETAAGLQRAGDIAHVDGVLALVLGGVDLGVQLRWEPRPDGLELLYARSKLVADSAAAGISPPIDVVHTDIAADEALAAECAFARSLGFGGKMCIHPRQVGIVTAAFAPTPEQMRRARRIVDAYEAARAAGSGVCKVDGAMVDLPVYTRALEIVNESGGHP